MNNLYKGISDIESSLLFSFKEIGKNIITPEDVVAQIECNINHAYVILHNLVKKGWLFRLKRGKYLVLTKNGDEFSEDPLNIISEIIKDYYISYISALNFYGFTEQVPATIFVNVTKRMKSINYGAQQIKFISIGKKKFFGYEEINYGKIKIKMADKEKALIDSLDKSEFNGGILEIIKCFDNAKKNIEINKIVNYGLIIKERALLRRLGLILDLIGLKLPMELENKMMEIVKQVRYYTLLDPMRDSKGTLNKKWMIKINIPKSELFYWRKRI